MLLFKNNLCEKMFNWEFSQDFYLIAEVHSWRGRDLLLGPPPDFHHPHLWRVIFETRGAGSRHIK